MSSFFAAGSALASMEADILTLQHRWAEVNYQLQGKTRLTAFEDLIADADKSVALYPQNADVLIWRGIIKSTFAGAKGGLGALKYAKSSKADLEKAIKIDPDSLDGAAYTSLGSLYFNVPGWPIGFGDDDKARELLQKALKISPDGIDSNYFYADFLRDQKNYQEAETYYLKAQLAPARPDRPLADSGRQKEILQALLEIRKKLDK